MCVRLPISSYARVKERNDEDARSAVLAGVNGHKENLRQSVANSLNVPQIFFLPVHFCMRDSRIWLHIMLPFPD